MSFLFFKNPVKKGFFRSPVRVTARLPSPPP